MFLRTCFAIGVVIAIGLAAVISKHSKNTDFEHLEEKHELKVTVNEEFVKTYLRTFGYLNASLKNPTNEEMSKAITAFQTFMGIPSTGVMNGATASLMARKRCGNKDVHPVEDVLLWKQDLLTWNITHFPTSISDEKLHELIRDAFSAWEVVINVSFMELDHASNADIVISFEHFENDWQNDATHLTIGRASGPIASRVWLSADEAWTTNPKDDGILLFNVLVHELGHVLGMRHSSDANSVMHPLFDRAMGKARPEVTIDDVERIRNLYDFALHENITIYENPNITEAPCFTSPQSILDLESNNMYFIFQDDRVWLSDNGSIFNPSQEIIRVFDSGPSYVNASVRFNNLSLLISDREIHGYYVDAEKGKITSASGFPKVIHNRVLFYPNAAFALTNGSLILINDDVFATYDLEKNVPTMLQDLRVYFPNLPVNIIGGHRFESDDENELYVFYNKTNKVLYDMLHNNILGLKKIDETFKCDIKTAML